MIRSVDGEHDTLVRAGEALPDMVARLADLVGCESPSDSPADLRRCADLLVSWLAPLLPHRVELLERDGLPHVLAAAAHPTVLLLGHFDTVWPLGTLTDWPFTVRDGIARGPGVFDMKAGIVQLVTALALHGDPGRVSVLLTGDEEIGSRSAWTLIEEQARRAGAVLVCEPAADGGAVKVGRKGIANYDIEIRGRAAHAGLEPERGVNAGVELAHQILALTALADRDTTVTPTVLSAGTTGNTVPERAHCHVDVRSWTTAAMADVDRALTGLRPHLPGAEVVVTGGIDRLPFEERAAAGLLAHAEAAADELGLGPLATATAGGVSDGNISAAAGVPTLDGLGAIGGYPHARDEHVQVHTMPRQTALLTELLARLAQRRPGRLER